MNNSLRKEWMYECMNEWMVLLNDAANYEDNAASIKHEHSLEHFWNATDRTSPVPAYTTALSHFVRHKSHRNWHVSEPGIPLWEAGD